MKALGGFLSPGALQSLLSDSEHSGDTGTVVFEGEMKGFALSSGARRLLGVENEFPTDLRDAFPGMASADRRKLEEAIRSAVLLRQHINLSFPYSREGESLQIALSITPGADNATSKYVIASVADETKFEKEREAFRMQSYLLQQIQDSVIAVNAEGIVYYWNTGAEKIFRRKQEDMLGFPIYKLNPAFNMDEYRELHRKGNQSKKVEWTTIQDGKEIWVRVTANAIVDENGEFAGVIGVAKDISEEIRLRRQNEEQRRALNALQEAANVALIVVNSADQIEMINEVGRHIFERQSGMTIAQGASIESLQFGEISLSSLLKVLRTTPDSAKEVRIKVKDEEKWYRVEGKQFDEGQTLLTIYEVTELIEHQREIESLNLRLREREKLSRYLLEHGNEAVIMLGEDFSIEYATSSLKNLLGIDDRRLLGKSLSGPQQNVSPLKDSGFSLSDADSIREVALRLKKGEYLVFHAPHTHAEGHLVWIEWHMRNELEEAGVMGVICTLRDVTLQREYLNSRAETLHKLELEKKAAEELHQLKNAFLANMSHEIRTPLNGIIGLSHLIKHESDQDTIKEYADIQNESSRRLLQTVNDILEMAKLESGKFNSTGRSLVARSVSEILKPLSYQARQKGLELHFNSSVNESTSIPIGIGTLNLIINNLVGNAIKFTPKGEVRVDITPCDDQCVCIKISDTGIGVAPEALDRIFQPFEQESIGTGRRFEGSGLGLAIAKRFIELSGGDVKVKSEKGSGSTFTIVLPEAIND